SLISTQTTRQLSEELGVEVDKRRFRANVYVDLVGAAGFAEDGWVGHRLKIGRRAEIVVTGPDSRCKMITLDPDTGQANPDVIRRVTRDHGGTSGIYAAVIAEGVICVGDAIDRLDWRPGS